MKFKKFSEEAINSGNKITNAIVTSYEMVCATARKAPRSAYLELEDHPEINVP